MKITDAIVEFGFDCKVRKLSKQLTFDADCFVVDPATLTNMRDMVQEVIIAKQTALIETVPTANIAA